MAGKRLVLFHIADQVYGMDMESITAIEHFVEITPIEEAPGYIDGVISVRGNVIPVYSLRAKFGLNRKEYANDSHFILTHTGGMEYAIAVDSVDEILVTEEGGYYEVPALLQSDATSYLDGIANKEGKLISILSSEKLISSDKFDCLNLEQEEVLV